MDVNKLMELMKQKKAALKQKSKTLKPNPGANRYIILPGWRKGEEHIFQHEFGQHFIKDEAGDLKAVYPCMDATFGKPCPVCDGIAKAIRMASDPDVVEKLEEAACGGKKQTYLVNVLALDSDDVATPQILELKKSAFGQLVEIVEEWFEGVFDPENPQIVIVNRDGKGLNTKYTVQISNKRSAMPKGALSKINNLDEYVAQENEESQRRALGVINSVAGLLPAGEGKDRPRTSAPEEDEFGSIEGDAHVVEKASKSKFSGGPIALDSELDDLLGELDERTGTDA